MAGSDVVPDGPPLDSEALSTTPPEPTQAEKVISALRMISGLGSQSCIRNPVRRCLSEMAMPTGILGAMRSGNVRGLSKQCVGSSVRYPPKALSMDDIWGVRANIEERFPGVPDDIRWLVCLKLYVKGNAVQETKLQLFRKDGSLSKLALRHPLVNTRVQASATIEYAGTFCRKSYLYAFAGPMFWIDADPSVVKSDDIKWFIGGGTRCAAFYHAIANYADNQNCIAATLEACELGFQFQLAVHVSSSSSGTSFQLRFPFPVQFPYPVPVSMSSFSSSDHSLIRFPVPVVSSSSCCKFQFQFLLLVAVSVSCSNF